MLRRVLFAALLLCLSAWAAEDRGGIRSPGDIAGTASTPSTMSEESSDADTSGQRWLARHRSIVSTHDSGRSSQLHDAELTRVFCRNQSGACGRARPHQRPTPARSPHLHDIPLLI